MNKISRILVMALVMLAMITVSLNVNASVEELKNYVNSPLNINNMVFELTASQKTAVLAHIATLNDATADAVLADVRAAENLVRSTGAKSLSELSSSVKSQVINLATSASTKAGLTLTVNTANNTFTLKNGGTVLTSGNADSLVSQATNLGGGAPAAGGSSSNGSASTLLYTGSNFAVYSVALLAIVAVAIVVKKRA